MSSSLTLDGDRHLFSGLIYSLFLESGSTFRTGRWIIVQLCSSHMFVMCALSIVQMHNISQCLLLRPAFGDRFGSRVTHRHGDVGGACVLVIQEAGAINFSSHWAFKPVGLMHLHALQLCHYCMFEALTCFFQLSCKSTKEESA